VAEARERNVPLNVVDDPKRSNFYFTAVHRTGDVVVSVSTEGASPALAQVLRDRIRDALPANTEDVARALRAERAELHRRGESTEGIDWRQRVESLLC
jgi:siroheme synthase-like protein